jgi:hypothetical protein
MIDEAKPEGKGQVKPKNEPWFKIALSGTCDNIWQQERAAHIRGTASIALEEALALTGKDLVATLEPKGRADATIALNGSMAQIDLETTINLLNAGFTIPQVMRKETNTPGTLIVDAKHDMGHAFLIDNFELTLDNARIEGNVQVTPKNEPWLKTTFTTSGFPLMHLDRLPSVSFKDGTLALTGEVWQETPSHKDLHYRGNATIEQATLIAQLLKEPVRDLDARIEIADQHADLPSASFAVGESRYQLQAEVSGFSVPRITGRLYTDALDINEIVSAFAKQKPGGKKTTSSKTPTRPNFSIELLIEADAMCAGKFRTGAVSTIWHTSGRIQEFYPIAIDAYRGNLRGGFYLALLGNNAYWVSDFSGQNMNLEVVVDHLLEETIKGDVKNGLLSMEGTLSGVASRKREDVWKSLDGELKVRMIDGEIKKSPMFNSIMLATQLPVSVLLTSKAFSVNSLLETAKTRGRTLLDNPVIFKKIEGAFRIDTGVAHTEDLYFEGKTADILFRGDLNLVNEQIDMRISVAPIGPTGSILRKVPAIGKRMDRSIKSIFSLSFIAQGSISNPGLRLSTVDTLKPMRRKK